MADAGYVQSQRRQSSCLVFSGSTSLVPALDLAFMPFMHLIHMKVRDIHHYPPTFFVTELPLLRKQLPPNFDGQLQSVKVRFHPPVLFELHHNFTVNLNTIACKKRIPCMFWGDKYCPFVLQFETCISKHTIIPANMDPANRGLEDYLAPKIGHSQDETVHVGNGKLTIRVQLQYQVVPCSSVWFKKKSVYIYIFTLC